MSMGARLFGTDGVRGLADRYPLDRETVWKLGRALAAVLETHVTDRPLRVVLGEDTRESSARISRTLAQGLVSAGVSVHYAGVIPTAGVAFLTRHHRFAAGVMVSASHNPFEDNGIKVLTARGTKISSELELEVERALERPHPRPPEVDRDLTPIPELREDYLAFLADLVVHNPSLSRWRLVVDCANGAASAVVPALLSRLGIHAQVLHATPTGRNINLGCGSLHPQTMAQITRTSTADLGVAFDGDADRAIFATSEGHVADGDHVLYAVAPFFRSRGSLKGDAVVGTLMTNLGLEFALARHHIKLRRTGVGDKYVLEEMLKLGINLGGEPSGHIIFSDISLAGDGIITLLEVLRVMSESGDCFSQLLRGFKPFPQIIHNVPVREKQPLESIPAVVRATEACRREMGERGRVVVRYSGTEAVARVMVEAEDAQLVRRHAARIAAAIEATLGK